MSQSKELTHFYNDYYRWVNGEKNDIFIRANGLCSNLRRFCKEHYGQDFNCYLIEDELLEQFSNAGLGRYYPFNNVDNNDYNLEEDKTLNEKRIQWVKEHLNG